MSETSSNSNGILQSLQASLGKDLVETILKSKLLLVGAGGIGCELLKNLALTGFGYVEVIDLDTIDVSNLNRQLLFRSQHVGQPKCVVACQVARELSIADNPQYIAHHGNVCDNSQFNVEYIKRFDLILNALDNVVARRRVNRLALATGVPLIDSGTTGYLGQVSTIHKASETACYECQTQETGKVYPICTIRSTPSAPVHCIVWAKEFYKLLFGKAEESMLYEDKEGSGSIENGEDTDRTSSENTFSTYMPAVDRFREMMGSGIETDPVILHTTAITLLRNIFVDEINKQLDMDRYKTARKKPVVLPESILSTMEDAPTTVDSWNHTHVWSDSQCVSEFIACLRDAVGDREKVLPNFDKDDVMAMRFVTATANLRSSIFGIEPTQSYYSTKGIAGNIIPAISTTNAIVAGLQILQCFQVLKAQNAAKDQELTTLREYCKYVNCVRNPTRNGLYLTAGDLEYPNPKCFICRKAIIPLTLNVRKWILQDFLSKIIKEYLGFEAPSITMDSGDYIWEEGDDADDFSMNLSKKLTELPCGGIHHMSVITVEDFTQDLTAEMIVTHVESWPESEGEEISDDHKFVVGGCKPIPTAVTTDEKTVQPGTKNDVSEHTTTNESAAEDEDIVEIVCGPVDVSTKTSSSKRVSQNHSVGLAPPVKKSKTKVEIIEID